MEFVGKEVRVRQFRVAGSISTLSGWFEVTADTVPERLRLELLPAYTPECNPTEHVWDETREKGFANQFFADLAGVEVRLETELLLLLNDPPRLRKLTCFPWIPSGLLYL